MRECKNITEIMQQNCQVPLEMPISNSSFPEGIMINFLLRLPVKSLLRFKAVCKSWRDLITSPYFVEMHLHHSKTNEKLLKACLNPTTYDPEITLLKLCCDHAGYGESLSGNLLLPLHLSKFEEVVIEASCNGLVSLRSRSIPGSVLCNPTTRKFRQLKLPFIDCSPCVGIYFLAENKDYKMVRIQTLLGQRSSLGTNIIPVWIYSLNDDSWKKLDTVFPYEKLQSEQPILFNECMHWIADEGEGKIVAFDVKKEVFQYMSLPVTKGLDSRSRKLLAIIKGSLSVVLTIRNQKYQLAFEVWKMNEYGSEGSWSKLFFMATAFHTIAFPVGSWKDGKILFKYYCGNDEKLFSYDHFTKKVERFCNTESLNLQIINYVETLESVEGGMRRSSQNRVTVAPTRATSTVGCTTSHGSDSGNLSMGAASGQPNHDPRRMESSSSFGREICKKIKQKLL